MTDSRPAPRAPANGVADRLGVDPARCVVELGDEAQAELDWIARVSEEASRQLPLPACAWAMGAVARTLRGGAGFAVLDRLPVERYELDQVRRMGLALVSLVGCAVAQKLDGRLVHDVRDTGLRERRDGRPSLTDVEQPYHTDGGWLASTPDAVALLCVRPVGRGGAIRIASLAAAHARLERECPDLLQRLYEPYWWDRQGEHPPDEPPVSSRPVFWRAGDVVGARWYEDHVRAGHLLAAEPIDARGEAALAALRGALEAPVAGVDVPVRDGQMIVLDNRLRAHALARGDETVPGAAPRHLLRYWIRAEGAPEL